MKPCEFCEQWGQWRMYWVKRQTDEQRKLDAAKKLSPKGPDFERGPLLCTKHKQEMELQPSDLKRSFVFIGAAPLGPDHTESRPNL